MLFCSSRTIDRWVKRFRREGVEAVAGHKPGRPLRFGPGWLAVAVAWVTTKAPRNFGFHRSRWCCELVAVLMLRAYDLEMSRETVRRWLHLGGLVYRRPRPVLKPDREERQARLAELRRLLAELPDDETAVFQDEVDVNTNPKIGSMWMYKGQQAELETPGDNEKRYLAGSIHWRRAGLPHRGQAEAGADEALFLAHLNDLRGRLRRYKKIHVICDNAKFHKSEAVTISLWDHHKRSTALPAASQPGLQPDRAGLVASARAGHAESSVSFHGGAAGPHFAWLGSRNPFTVEGSVYKLAAGYASLLRGAI